MRNRGDPQKFVRFQKERPKDWSMETYMDFISANKKENKKHMTTENVWAQEAIVNANDYSGSKFLNKALQDGDSIKLTFTAVIHQDQDESTSVEYRNADGKEWNLYFTDEQGRERMMTQRSTKGKLFSAMRAASIQPNTKIIVTRTGSELKTEYEVALDAGQSAPAANVSTDTEATPF